MWTRQVFRGPEYAIALPGGDLGALMETMSLASTYWNGSGTLLLPVDPAGTTDGTSAHALSALPPDRVLLHPALSARAIDALTERWPGRAGPMNRHATEQEMRPLWLAPRPSNERPRLIVPRPNRTLASARLITALWGSLDLADEDLCDRYEVHETSGDAWADAVVRGQTVGESPLEWSARLTPAGTVNGPMTRLVFMFSRRPSFAQLTTFWNIRARRGRFGWGVDVVGLPADALSRDGVLETVRAWAAQDLGTRPHFFLWAQERESSASSTALVAAGFIESAERRVKWWTEVPSERAGLEFLLGFEHMPLKVTRGISEPALRDLRAGVNPVDVRPPAELEDISWFGGRMRLELLDLPVSLPITDRAAARITDHAFAAGDRSGVVITTDATSRPMRLTLNLPSQEQQLEDYLASKGLSGRLSDKGRMLIALLRRLDGRAALETLARPIALAIIAVLTPRAAAQLARSVTHHLSPGRVDEQELARLLARADIAGVGASANAHELGSALGVPRNEILTTLDDLVSKGWVQQGKRARCPHCDTETFWTLDDLADLLLCAGCRQGFRLPVRVGYSENPGAYRLDPLMSRVMQQGGAAVLLTVRRLLADHDHSLPYGLWPGIEFVDHRSDAKFEVDVLFTSRARVVAGECKSRAELLAATEASRHISISTRLGGVPLLASPEGDWSADVLKIAGDAVGAIVLARAQLVDAAS